MDLEQSLYTIEYIPINQVKAKKNIKKFDYLNLDDYIEWVMEDSRKWIEENSHLKFDFGFFDSELRFRHVEYKLLKENDMLNDGFVAMFHDTSRRRGTDYYPNNCSPEMIEELDRLSKGEEWIENPLSRGFRLLRYKQ